MIKSANRSCPHYFASIKKTLTVKPFVKFTPHKHYPTYIIAGYEIRAMLRICWCQGLFFANCHRFVTHPRPRCRSRPDRGCRERGANRCGSASGTCPGGSGSSPAGRHWRARWGTLLPFRAQSSRASSPATGAQYLDTKQRKPSGIKTPPQKKINQIKKN